MKTIKFNLKGGFRIVPEGERILKITEYKIQKELNKFTGARLFY